MSKKKDFRDTDFEPTYEPQDDSELEGEESGTWFPFNAEAYTVDKKADGNYDLLVVKINTENDTATVERVPTRYNTVQRALMDIQVRMEQELTKRGNK